MYRVKILTRSYEKDLIRMEEFKSGAQGRDRLAAFLEVPLQAAVSVDCSSRLSCHCCHQKDDQKSFSGDLENKKMREIYRVCLIMAS